jgi:hypothetical protein
MPGAWGGIIDMQTVQGWRQERTLWHYYLYFSWHRHFALNQNSEFYV